MDALLPGTSQPSWPKSVERALRPLLVATVFAFWNIAAGNAAPLAEGQDATRLSVSGP
jgi:hypothetical protein